MGQESVNFLRLCYKNQLKHDKKSLFRVDFDHCSQAFHGDFDDLPKISGKIESKYQRKDETHI
jgi:hypothetical protein